MAKITGRLITDLYSDGSVQMLFIPTWDSAIMQPLLFKNLDAALDFMITFLAPDKAVSIREQLRRDGMVDAAISIEEEFTASFRIQPVRVA